MSDLISRSALLEELREDREWFEEAGEKTAASFVALAMKRTRNAPAIDAALVVHARWEPIPESITPEGMLVRCTNEGCTCITAQGVNEGDPGLHYCPNCGAKMDGGAA